MRDGITALACAFLALSPVWRWLPHSLDVPDSWWRTQTGVFCGRGRRPWGWSKKCCVDSGPRPFTGVPEQGPSHMGTSPGLALPAHLVLQAGRLRPRSERGSLCEPPCEVVSDRPALSRAVPAHGPSCGRALRFPPGRHVLSPRPASAPSGVEVSPQQRVGWCGWAAEVTSLLPCTCVSGGTAAKSLGWQGPGEGWALSWGLRGQGCGPTAASDCGWGRDLAPPPGGTEATTDTSCLGQLGQRSVPKVTAGKGHRRSHPPTFC